MSSVLSDLIELLRLDRLDEKHFRGTSQDLGWGQLFGGQVLGQSLSAAVQTVPSDRHVHSLHSYFLRFGNIQKPIDFTVESVRDGFSFSTRSVLATQDDVPIFQLTASFQTAGTGFSHQDPMPKTPDPEDLTTDAELWGRYFEKLPESMRAMGQKQRPIELRPVAPLDPFVPTTAPPEHAVWMRATGTLPDDEMLHRCLLAYSSDFLFLPTAMRPHGITWLTPKVQIASVDHSIWFHRPFRMDDWLLHVMHSPSAFGGRGFVRGSVFSRDGKLVASTAQEGVMRNRR